MRSAKLAEAIILQAIDDLYDVSECDGSVDFFTGEGFAECSDMADMGHDSRMGVLGIVSAVVSRANRPGFREICVSGDYGMLYRGRRSRAQGTM